MTSLRTDTAPPGGYTAQIPAIGWAGTDLSFDALVAQVKQLLDANKLPGDPVQIVTVQTIERLLAEDHHEWIIDRPDAAPRTISDAIAGSAVLATFAARSLLGRPTFVDPIEAERRAQICSGCPQNAVPKDESWASKWAGGVMRKKVEGRTTQRDGLIGVCGLCKCELRAAVHFDEAVLASGMSQELKRSLPEKCWKKSICLAGCKG